MMGWTLVPCDAQARPLALPPSSPWGRYLALAGTDLVGGGGFAGPPVAGRVEIGYFSLPDQQRRGHGRRTAAELLRIAHQADPSLTVIAHTKRQPDAHPVRSPSARILRSLGFGSPRAAHDSALGAVWCWTWAAPERLGQVGGRMGGLMGGMTGGMTGGMPDGLIGRLVDGQVGDPLRGQARCVRVEG